MATQKQMENITNSYCSTGGDSRLPQPVTPKKSIIGGCVSWVGSNASVTFGIVAVLVLIIIVLVVYYRGIWIFGPYASKTKADSDKKVVVKEEKKADEKKVVKEDEETRKLIDSINGAK